MRKHQEIKPVALFTLCICLLPILSVKADTPTAQEWTDIPVVINVVDNSSTTNAEDAIKKANEILAQAHIRLVVQKTNNNVNVGNGDASLSRDERDEARQNGQTELNNTCGAGKGLKINIADNCFLEDPYCWGVAVHRNPVVIVEPRANAKDMGRTIAHEICHSLTLDYDSYDANDVNNLMYGYSGGGTVLGPNDINEIFKNAKKRGKPYYVVPEVLPGRAVAIPPGVEYSIDAHGAVLDGFFDVFCPDPGFNPRNPDFTYADLREVSLFWDKPADPCSEILLEIQLGGNFPTESFFDVFVEVNINKDLDPAFDALISMSIRGIPLFGLVTIAQYQDLDTGLIYPLKMAVHRNNEFDGPKGPTPINHSLEVSIPAGFFGPGSDPFEGEVCATCSSHATDSRLATPMIDETSTFEFALTQPCAGSQMQFIDTYGGGESRFGVCGSGFVSGSQVIVLIDGQMVGMTQAKADGTVTHLIGPEDMLEEGMHECTLSAEMIYPHEPDSISFKNATGYFTYCPGGEVESDLDGDCDVDFYDLAKLADNWLAGK